MSLVNLVVVVAIAASITAATMRVAGRLLLDHPNQRSSHTVPTPRGGGLGIVSGWVAGILISGEPAIWSVLPPVLAIAALSFVDDVRSLPAKVRLAGHLVVALAAVLTVGSMLTIAIPPFGSITSAPLVVVLTVVWLAGLGNAFNFMDGIDGIAALQGIVAGLAWWWIGSSHGLDHPAMIGASLAAACVGFLPFNWQPARIFMGDVGSITLGLVIAIAPILAAQAGAESWAAPVGVLVVWPFLFDVCFTFVRRLSRGEPVLEAHRSHLYQRLIIAGWSHRATAITYGLLASGSAIAAARVPAGEWWWGLAAAVLVSAALLLITRRAEIGLATS